MNITDLLDRPIAYHRVFVTLTGSIKAAVLLSQAIYWQKRAKQADGWWYKTAEEWNEETGLTRHELDRARKDSEKYLMTDVRDVPPRLYWKVDEESLEKALLQFDGKRQIGKSQNRQNGMSENGKSNSRKAEKLNRYAENTAETTTENTLTTAAASQSVLLAYKSCIGSLTPMMIRTLSKAESIYPSGWIIESLQIAAESNVKKWVYAEAILKRWERDGKVDTRGNGHEKITWTEIVEESTKEIPSGAELKAKVMAKMAAAEAKRKAKLELAEAQS